jgi:glutamine---fructose-6-phosphate transaminase (isomerizing)
MTEKVVKRLSILERHLNFDKSSLLKPTCGIIAYIGDQNCNGFLLEGLSILQNRGYDSAGMATLSLDHNLFVSKFASRENTSDSIETLQKNQAKHEGHKIGIAHTRWATHGGKTDNNAHPHLDSKNRIAIVHNGIIENCEILREQLKSKGVVFRSETDSEVIAQMIGFEVEKTSFEDAVRKVINCLEGTWGLVVMDRQNPDRLIAARNGSPLLIGHGANQMFVSSEPLAFSKFTREYIALENGEIAIIKQNSHTLDTKRIKISTSEKILNTPEPYPHWTLKEIIEQPSALSRVLNYGGRIDSESSVRLGGLSNSAAELLKINHLIISACGTSLNAAEYGSHLMRTIGCFESVQTVDAAEIIPQYFKQKDCGLLVISQSGETKDVHNVVMMAQNQRIPVFSCINSVDSLIARTTQCGVYINAGREVSVASTKAFTCQIATLFLIAIWFHQHRCPNQIQIRKSLIEDLHRLPTMIGACIDRNREKSLALAQTLLDKESIFVLGKGYGFPVAKEGSLKLKEITYIHAEGYSGGALKHGPFALIEEGMPVILIILNDEHLNKMLTCAAEVKARGAFIIGISNIDTPQIRDLCRQLIIVPSNGSFSALQTVIPLQLISYYLGVARSVNPDKPRNLAKAVTVD